jgi:hypothetical protein
MPFNLIWMPGKTEPIILSELLTPGAVLDALKKGWLNNRSVVEQEL